LPSRPANLVSVTGNSAIKEFFAVRLNQHPLQETGDSL